MQCYSNQKRRTKRWNCIRQILATFASFRDGPLEKLWGGGGKGNFRAAEIFFRYPIPCMNFLQAIALIFFRINWRALIFFSFNFPLREYFFCTSPAPPPPINFLMVRPLGIVANRVIYDKTLKPKSPGCYDWMYTRWTGFLLSLWICTRVIYAEGLVLAGT